MKTSIVACLLSAVTLTNARNDRRLGSNLGAIGGINGELRAGVEQLGPHGRPGYTASIGAGVGARLGGQGSLGLGGYGDGYPGSYGLSWGGAYGAAPYGGYAHYGAPYGGGYYGLDPYGHHGLYGSAVALLPEQLGHLAAHPVLHPLPQRKGMISKMTEGCQNYSESDELRVLLGHGIANPPGNMKTFIVVCLLSAAALTNARRQGALGSNLGATGGIRGELRAGVERAGPSGGPGLTASIGGNLGARLGGQAGIGAGSYGFGGGAGYPGSYGSPWGGAYGGYSPYGAPFGSGYHGFNPYGDYGSFAGGAAVPRAPALSTAGSADASSAAPAAST
ncbi:hypothetical protein MTO96_050642 [Rhipicephalus appendiculatus]